MNSIEDIQCIYDDETKKYIGELYLTLETLSSRIRELETEYDKVRTETLAALKTATKQKTSAITQ